MHREVQFLKFSAIFLNWNHRSRLCETKKWYFLIRIISQFITLFVLKCRLSWQTEYFFLELSIDVLMKNEMAAQTLKKVNCFTRDNFCVHTDLSVRVYVGIYFPLDAEALISMFESWNWFSWVLLLFLFFSCARKFLIEMIKRKQTSTTFFNLLLANIFHSKHERLKRRNEDSMDAFSFRIMKKLCWKQIMFYLVQWEKVVILEWIPLI